MAPDYREVLRNVRKDLVRKEFDERDYEAVVGAIPIPADAREREMHALSRYELAKSACAANEFEQAREHASAVEQLKPSDSAIRALTSQRLRLLSARPRVPKPEETFAPGTVSVAGIGRVMVLGRYEARGKMTGLTQAVLLLKKAPSEIEDVERGARGTLVDQMGLLLWESFRQTDAAKEIDLVIPIPPDPGRYSDRLYHSADDIAKSFSKHSTTPIHIRLLSKTRSTTSLRTLSSSSEREQEIRGSMQIDASKSGVLSDRSVLLIDDVVTHGTHFREAKRVLQEAGAGKVHASALTTAHGRPRPL